jgi:hypothetical protein
LRSGRFRPVDAAHAAQLRKRWDHFGLDTPLRVVDVPDRRINRAAQVFVAEARDEHPDTNVTVLLPRRTFARLLGRLLHDRTADKIAQALSLIPEQLLAHEIDKVQAWVSQGDDEKLEAYKRPGRPPSVIMVAGLIPGQRGTVEGRVSEVQDVSERRRTGLSGLRRRRRQRRADRHVPSRRRRRGHRARSAVADHREGAPDRQPAHVDGRPAYHAIEDPATTTGSGDSDQSG